MNWVLFFFSIVPLGIAVILLSVRNQYLSNMIRRQSKEILSLNRKRTDFVANVSHELKTPLTSIRGYTETLRNGALKDPKKADEFLQKIEANTERLDLLIHDILNLSKLEASDAHLQISTFSVEELLLGLREEFALKLEQKNQTLTVENSVKTLTADRMLVEQAFSNLISNAIRYCPSGANFRIQGRSDTVAGRASHMFEVIDNGPGISETDLPQIFERFYRADKSRSRDFGGTGLGLAIVKHILLSHRGNVRAENIPSGGMKFSLIFPASDEL